MKATLIDGNGLHELNLTNDSITAVYIPSSDGGLVPGKYVRR